MTIKTFERPIIELSHNVVFKKAKLIDNEYKISITDLSESERSDFLQAFLKVHTNLNQNIQEYLNEACQDRMYAEMETLGGFDE